MLLGLVTRRCSITCSGGSAPIDAATHGCLLALQRRQALRNVWPVVELCSNLLLVTDHLAANQPHASHALVEQLRRALPRGFEEEEGQGRRQSDGQLVLVQGGRRVEGSGNAESRALARKGWRLRQQA